MDYTVQEIAIVTHEANRAIQRVTEDPNPSAPWDETTQDIRDSAIDGVTNALNGASPQEAHENWVRFKENDGWVWGETKDAVAKTHPALVPYNELPEDQLVKDRVFVAIVRAMAGYKQVDDPSLAKSAGVSQEYIDRSELELRATAVDFALREAQLNVGRYPQVGAPERPSLIEQAKILEKFLRGES